MRGVGVLVGVAVSGVAGAWVTKLVVGSVTAPLFFFGAEEAPTLTPHWKLVLVGGGLLEAMVAALLLVGAPAVAVRVPDRRRPGLRRDADRQHGRRLALLIIGEARIHASSAYLPTLALDTLACALLGIGVSSVLVMAGVRGRRVPAGAYPAGSFGELRRTAR